MTAASTLTPAQAFMNGYRVYLSNPTPAYQRSLNNMADGFLNFTGTIPTDDIELVQLATAIANVKGTNGDMMVQQLKNARPPNAAANLAPRVTAQPQRASTSTAASALSDAALLNMVSTSAASGLNRRPSATIDRKSAPVTAQDVSQYSEWLLAGVSPEDIHRNNTQISLQALHKLKDELSAVPQPVTPPARRQTEVRLNARIERENESCERTLGRFAKSVLKQSLQFARTNPRRALGYSVATIGTAYLSLPYAAVVATSAYIYERLIRR